MAHGTPDWGLVGPKSVTYGLDDLGEAVVRLGSPVIWDRRGDVILLDSFEEGLGLCNLTTFNPGDYYRRTTDASRHGALSLLLHADGLDDSYARVEWFIAVPGSLQVGFEISFGARDEYEALYWQLLYFDGTDLLTAEIRYVRATRDLEYLDSDGNYQTLRSSLDLYVLLMPVHVFKLVVDFATGHYVRLIMSQHTFDMSTCALRSTPNPIWPTLWPRFWIDGEDNGGGEAIVDRCIVTQNEPA
ncbi:MAG: hypothetical protein KAX80_00025 [Planctomycetes bacterium]|nr:hypothetical protein [Planctomycetota bacterium]